MTDDFFSGLRQLDKSIAGVGCKMPFFNRDGRIFSVSFPAPIGHLRKLIANRDVSPARVLPGMGLVQLSAYEWRDTDAGSFNEFSVVIPLYSPRFPKLPSYNLKKTSAAGEVYNFLLHRATNSEVVLGMTREYFRWPVFQASIDFSESDDWLTCEVKEKEELVCRLRGRKLPTQPVLEGSAGKTAIFIQAPQHLQAQRVDLNSVESVASRDSSDAEVTLGLSHPIAVELSATLKSIKPRMYTYAPSCQAIAYGPGGPAGSI